MRLAMGLACLLARVRGFLALAILLVSGAGQAEPVDSLRYRHYQVDLDGWGSLSYLLTRASPLKQDGQVFHGYTKWEVNWSFSRNETSEGCRIQQVSTLLSTQITLPYPEGGSPRRREQFGNYAHALYQHEQGHYRFGQMAAAHVDSELSKIPAQADCQSLVESANAEARRIIRHYTEMERKYDLLTEHGGKQDANIALYDAGDD